MATIRSVAVRSLALLAVAVPTFLLTGAPVQAIRPKPSREVRDHPEAVLITARNSRSKVDSSCVGALIAPNAVLTAAHCALGFDTWDILAPYAKKGANQATAKTARLHPDFKRGRYENDLAVLILDRAIDIGQKFPALHSGGLYPINTKLVAVGRVEHGSVSRSKLFQAPVTLVAFPENVNVYGGNPQVIEKGDSGGPIYVAGKEQEIVAVVSGFLNFSRWNVPTDLYVPLNGKARDWILLQIPRKTAVVPD